MNLEQVFKGKLVSKELELAKLSIDNREAIWSTEKLLCFIPIILTPNVDIKYNIFCGL